MRILLLCLIFSSFLGQGAYAGEQNWKLIVVYNEVDVGGHTLSRGSYDLAWIRNDSQKPELLKQLKDAKRAANQGTKNKFYTQTASTSGSRYAVMFEYSLMKPMRAGGSKPTKGLKLRKGTYVGAIKESWGKDKSTQKYLESKIVEIIDMHAAKEFLNNVKNAANPYIGSIPTRVIKSPCETDLWSEACQEFTEKHLKSVAFGTRG